MPRQIKPVFQPVNIFHRLDRCIKDLYIGYSVKSVVCDIVIFIIVADEIIPSVCRNHLIRVDDILSLFALAVQAGVLFHI